VIALALAVFAASCSSVKIPASGSRQTVLYFSAPTDLRPGARLDPDDLNARLERLGYREVDEPSSSGEFRRSGSRFEVGLRPFDYPDRQFAGGRVRVWVAHGEVSDIEVSQEVPADEAMLEPERIAGFEGGTGAVLAPLALADAPDLLVPALLAVEDRRFYSHLGIDPVGTARAVWANVRRGPGSQGGSTLTQQLARSLFLRNEKTLFRKAREAVIALQLEARYSKQEILEGYLNAVYWGVWGSMEIRGAREAARYYLGKELEDADVAGIALLVGLIQAPNAYSPYNSPEKAKKRRDTVLRVLREQGIIDESTYEAAKLKKISTKQAPARSTEASYFIDAAQREMQARGAGEFVEKRGTRIFTTLDPRDQAACVASVRQGLDELEKSHRKLKRDKDPLQASAISIEPATGEIRGLVGGRDFLRFPFNRAVEAKRQPGSLFKPFVYLAAFRAPMREDGSWFTPATILSDEEFEIKAGGKRWRPRDYDRTYHGDVTARTALEKSLNVPTARVGLEIGPPAVARAAHDLGIQSQLVEVPSIALGTSDVSLVEVTAAYSGLAHSGAARAPTCLDAVVAEDGHVVALQPLPDPPGVESQPAYLVARLMEGVMSSGTGAAARTLGVEGTVAGKSGTTDDYRDAWFCGFTRERAVGVWVGFDKKGNVGLSGSAAALPIWARIVRDIQRPGGDGRFDRPSGIIRVPMDPTTGLLASADCPEYLEEDFIQGTEPQETCTEHAPQILDRVRRWWPF